MKNYEGNYNVNEEQWRPIASHYESRLNYQISTTGRLRRMWSDGTYYLLTPQKINKAGYMAYHISGVEGNRSGIMVLVHRLVAEAFIPNFGIYDEVNHKNQDVTDNRKENLEWCSRTYNMNYGDRAVNFSKSKSIPVYCITTGKWYPSAKATSEDGFIPSNITHACKHTGYAYKLEWRYATDSDVPND